MTYNTNTSNNTNNHIDNIADKYSSLDNPNDISKQSGCRNLALIPILPVRYGLTLDYTSNAIKGNIAEISTPKGLNSNAVHWIQTLRQGFVYIYAPNGHHDISTDRKNGGNSGGNWLVFRYATNTSDANSGEKFDGVDTDSIQQLPHFFLYAWGEEGAAGEWEKHSDKICTTLNKSTAFVHKDTSQVHIAYSEYPWPAELFDELATNDNLRKKLMIELNTVDRNKETEYTCPISLVPNKVVEFKRAKIIADLFKNTIFRHTRMKNEEWKGSDFHLEEDGFMVVLQDTLGEIKELQACHSNILDQITKCDLEYQYPLTIGTLIDPTTIYEAANKPLPEEFKKEEVTKKLTKQYKHLIPNFRKRLIQLIQEKAKRTEKYGKDLEKVVQQIIKLHKRNDILPLLKAVRGIAEDIKGEPLACIKAHKFSCYIIADSLAEIPTSTAGSSYLIKRFSKQKNDKERIEETKDNIGSLAETITGIIEVAEKFTNLDKAKVQKAEKLVYQSISILMTQIGNVFMFAAANASSSNFIIDRGAYFRLFGLDYVDLQRRSYAYLYEYIQQFNKRLKRVISRLSFKPSKGIGVQAQQNIAKILEHNTTKNVNTAFSSLGLFLSFTAFSDINDKISSSQMLARSTAGKIAHSKWIEIPKAALEFTVETVEVAKIASKSPIITNAIGARFQFINPLINKLNTRANKKISARLFKYTNNVLMLMGGFTFGTDAREDYLDQDYISMAGNIVSGIGAILAAFNFISLGLGTLIVLIGIGISNLGYDDFEDWLRTCIWGNSPEFLGSRRKGIEDILTDSAILSEPNSDSKNYALVFEAFKKELSDFNVLISSLSISEKEPGVFEISCNDFSNTTDNQPRLTITYDYSRTVPNAKGARVPDTGKAVSSYHPAGNVAVEVDLREDIKQLQTPIKLNVEYVTTYGNKLTQSYAQPGYSDSSIFQPAPFY